VPEVVSKLEELLRDSCYPTVSLDRVYAPNAAFYLEVTRLTNPFTGEVVIGPRPGTPNLKKQFTLLKRNLRNNQEINLVDVGAFEGETLLEVCEALENQGIKINQIFLGLSSNAAYEKISDVIKLETGYLFNFGEWVELRDLFGADGRKISGEEDSRLFIPYWENLDWASIPDKNKKSVKTLCKKYNAKLMGLLLSKFSNDEVKRRIGVPVRFGGAVR